MFDISFEWNEDKKKEYLKVQIHTERLDLKSVTTQHLSDYAKLFSSPKNMAKFASGQPWDAELIKARFNTWIKRWDENDPFSALAVSKNDTDEFIGHVIIGVGDKAGSGELAFIFDNKFWNQGYGKEAVVPIVTKYAPTLIENKYKVNKVEFTSVVATVHADNEASIRILKASGMKQEAAPASVNYGEQRYTFFASTSDLTQQFQNKKSFKESSTNVNNNNQNNNNNNNVPKQKTLT